ncbi:MAG: amidohydrolase family protein [Myxococcota bacterium]
MALVPVVRGLRHASWWLAVLVVLGCGRGDDAASPSPSPAPLDEARATTFATATSPRLPSPSPPSPSGRPALPLSRTSDPAPTPPPDGSRFRREAAVDVLITGGVVYDGSDGPALRADLVIDDGVVVHVGAVDPEQRADRRIDAAGRAVTPGFIDLHSHGAADAPPDNFLRMGVTTICIGQDGRSPTNEATRTWIRRTSRERLALNVAPFVGHGTVRNLTGVGASTDPSAARVERMVREIERDLDAGAWGLTTGLEYTPGRLASLDELVAIARPVAAHDGVIMSHLRSEDDDAVEAAADELIAQGERGGARVHVAHIKVVYGKGAARAEAFLAQLQDARDRGVKVTADLYPYNASYTTISIVFPDFAKPPHDYNKVKRTRREELATFLRTKVQRRGGPEATLFGSDPFRGKTLAQVATAKDKPFEDVLIDDVGPGGASAAYFVMDDALQARLARDKWVMFGTDGGPYSSHPRGYGAFAKVIQDYVVKRKLLSLGAAVHKMTGLAATTVGLDGIRRGRLAPGWAADVLIFDPAAVEARATYLRPRVYARGMDYVLINGRIVIDDGKSKKLRAGRLLLKSARAKE